MRPSYLKRAKGYLVWNWFYCQLLVKDRESASVMVGNEGAERFSAGCACLWRGQALGESDLLTGFWYSLPVQVVV